MTWSLPNYTSTIEYPVGSGTYPQSQWDQVDGEILQAGISSRTGVSSGCAVTQRAAGANQSVDVASGTVVYNKVEAVVTSGNVAASAAHSTLPRFDLVVASSAGVKSITAGTAATTPVFPAIPANSVVLAALFRRPLDDIIETAEIVDKRVPVDTPVPAVVGWSTVSKAADESTTADTTLSNDSTLLFTMAASTKYRVRLTAYIESPTAADFKWDITGPASPTIVTAYWGWGVAGGSPTWDAMATAYPSDSIDHASGTAAVLFLEIIVHNGANAGTFNFRWAQQTSNGGSTIVRAGSYLEYAIA